jgi:hypothetical protein
MVTWFRISVFLLGVSRAWPLQQQPTRPPSTSGGSGSFPFLASSSAPSGFTDAIERAFSLSSSSSSSSSSAVAPPSGAVPVVPPATRDTSWRLGGIAFSLLPLAPGARRKTIQTEVVRGSVWTHDQIQGVVNVNVPVRETVIKLRDGGLWIHNPVAPTFEHRKMIKELEAEHGPVKHIVLGTVGLEHKALAGPFAKAFPKAQVWLQPGQWSFPVPLPNVLYGFNPLKTSYLPVATGEGAAADAALKAERVPWSDEIGFEVLGPLTFKSVGKFGETAFVHRATGTLLVTDTIVKVGAEPPAIVAEDPRALLFHARDDVTESLVDTAATRRKGWRRIVQFGLIFFPSRIRVAGAFEALRDALQNVPEAMRVLSDGAVPLNLYPWSWDDGSGDADGAGGADGGAAGGEGAGVGGGAVAKILQEVQRGRGGGIGGGGGADADVESFEALQRSGGNAAGIFVAPILQEIILNREPEAVLEWVDRVATNYDFKRIIPCHMQNDVKATPADFVKAFGFLEQPPSSIGASNFFGGALGGGGGGGVGVGMGRPSPQTASAKKDDLALLQGASELLTTLGVVAPPAPRVPKGWRTTKTATADQATKTSGSWWS